MAALLGWGLAGIAAAGWLRSALRHRLRVELIARACHEVRGPLTAASLALHALPRSGGIATPAAVERELARAAAALRDVVAAGRGRRVRDRPEPVDLRELLALQAATWGPVARSLGRDLIMRGRATDVTVRADRVRLARATANLIANALEHGQGPVTVGATDRGDHVRIEVADAGRVPVTAPAALRSPGASRGRGLDIVADFAERHGGRLVSRSSTRGTRVAVELPRVEEAR